MHGSNRAAGKEGEHFVTQNEEIRRYFFKLSNFFFVQKWGFWRIPPHLSQERLNAVQFLSRIFPTRRSIHTPSESVHKKRRDLFGLWGIFRFLKKELQHGQSSSGGIAFQVLPAFCSLQGWGWGIKNISPCQTVMMTHLGKKLLSLSFSSSSLSAANISESLFLLYFSLSGVATGQGGWDG